MNKWSRGRKRIIFSIIIFILVVVIGIPVYLLFYRAPNCFDGKQNGDETGIDCGGSCQLLCKAESLPIIIKGDPRILKIRDNIFEIAVLMENLNTDVDIYRAGYTFKIYGVGNVIPLKVIEGETYVPKGSIFAIFEGPFEIKNGATPTRVTFEWKESTLLWQKNIQKIPEIIVQTLSLSQEDTIPRLNANIKNASLENISNIDLTAFIYDEADNIFAASKTFIETLSAGESMPVVFTWPNPFNKKSLSAKIIIRVFPDRSFTR